jgi:hypothetical protein
MAFTETRSPIVPLKLPDAQRSTASRRIVGSNQTPVSQPTRSKLIALTDHRGVITTYKFDERCISIIGSSAQQD